MKNSRITRFFFFLLSALAQMLPGSAAQVLDLDAKDGYTIVPGRPSSYFQIPLASPEMSKKWRCHVHGHSPEEPIWLRTLESQLGNFYLAQKYDRADDASAWVEDAPKLSRILNHRGFHLPGRHRCGSQAHKGMANVHRVLVVCVLRT